jgi:hypothetical protein
LQLGWNSGRAHKELVSRMSRLALWMFIIRDRSGGSVTLDPTGQPLHHYPLSDELDQRHFRDGMASLIRLHEAAGAERIHYSIMGIEPWERGQDIERWTDRLRSLPFGLGGLPAGSAHQMGTAPHGHRPGHLGRHPARRAARRPRHLDRRHQRLPHRLRRQPHVHLHGPRPPHRGDSPRWLTAGEAT